MKTLPRFVLVSHPDLPQIMVMETRPPYIIASPYCIPKKDGDRVDGFLTSIAHGRVTAVKVPGYTIFLTLWGSLRHTLPETPDEAKALLREMADFYKDTALAKNKHKSRIYEEGVPDDIDEQRGRYFKELKSNR